MTGEDLRDWPNVTLAEARDAADALGWTAEVERRVALDRLDAMRGHPPPAASLDDYRARFILELLGGIDAALRDGVAWEDFPEAARAFYLRALEDAGKEPPPPWVRPEV
jgi:hypothetical protein